jgi:polyisoprenoid-binding protein YceI
MSMVRLPRSHAMMMRALLAAALLGPFSASAFAQDDWSLSKGGGEVAFVARHFGIQTASGRFGAVDGTFALDFDRPERSRIRMAIQTASLRTGADLVDGFVKGQTMLDVAHYPVASFVSQQVVRTGERSLSITGQLTIRGASQPVTVIAVAESDPGGVRAGGTLPFHASASFSRAAFAIGREVNIVDDQVEIDIKGVISR